MPLPGPVSFTPFVDTYGQISLKDILVSSWGQDRNQQASNLSVPVIPIRTPMFRSRTDPSQRANTAAEASAQAGIPGSDGTIQDAPLEAGADLSRTWVLFLERILDLLKRTTDAATRLRKLHAVVCYVDETEAKDIWANIGAVDASTDPIVIIPSKSTPRTNIPPYAVDWDAGDYVVWNDPSRGAPMNGTVSTSGKSVDWVSGDTFEDTMPGHPVTINGTDYPVVSVMDDGKHLTITGDAGTQTGAIYTAESFHRRYECGQITAIDKTTGEWTLRRHWPQSQPANRATFQSYMESHGLVRLYRVQTSLFTYEVKPNAFLVDGNTDANFTLDPADKRNRFSGVPERWDITLPHAAVVCVFLAAENESGVGPWKGVNTSYLWSLDVRQLQSSPGLRTHVGAAYWFEEPGDIAARDRPDAGGGTRSTLEFYPTLPIRIQDWASIRTQYGFIGKPAVGPAGSIALSLRMKLLLAADRIDGASLYDPSQPWQDLEDLFWRLAAGVSDISSADQGTIEGVAWTGSQENPPTERRMPYCEGDTCHWDPEGNAKAWPPPVMEGDAWLTFDVLTVTLGSDGKPPADLTVVVQT